MACQRLGKVTEPISGGLVSFQRFTHATDSTFPCNVCILFWK